MTRRPFISVIIPHLNQPEALRRCLHALDSQSYPKNRFEVIVVDNGSSELPTAALAACPGIRLLHESRPGPGPARNRGAAESSGEILAFIDADCIPDRRWLDALAAALTRPGGPRIVGGEVRIALADANRPTPLEAYESIFAYRQKAYIRRQGFSGTGNLAVWRCEYEQIGPFAGINVAEDRDWGRRARAHGFAIDYVPDMIVFHPARTSLRQLRTKWSRQLRHDFADWRRSGRGALSWILRAIAVAGSPLRDIPRTFLSPRISGLATRCRAAAVLVYIRWVRSWQMIRLLTSSTDDRSALFWNRTEGPGIRPSPRRLSRRL